MASPTSSTALTKRSNDTALMPPPPTKRIKRPPKVLDEDDYTNALSKIVARDFFPGLHEVQSQQEYLNALESNDESWIAEAGQKLRHAMTPFPGSRHRRSARNSRFTTPAATPPHTGIAPPLADKTPIGWTGGATPSSAAGSEYSTTSSTQRDEIDTSTLSLSAFQSKYTSEDNESFNTLLDTQNATRRQKHAHLWTPDNKIPSARQIAYRAREQRLLVQKAEAEAEAANDGKELVPLVAGATDARPAKPDSWRRTKPDNALMFPAGSVDEDGIDTVAQVREASSKAGPKGVNYGNTRFASQALNEESTDGFVPPSPSLNTSIIARRDAARAARSETEYSGGETPRVNGYAYVDEDEPENIPQEAPAPGPSYRDLLAGMAGDGTPNPFKIGDVRRREDLHHRMVERDAKQKRLKSAETVRAPMPGTPGGSGNLTPAARKLLDRVGRTPVTRHGATKDGKATAKDMWTPSSTPHRKAGVVNKQ